ncbi:MAG: alpha-ketoacid dehydrogenase subunit beta [Nitrososphaerales archaeon]
MERRELDFAEAVREAIKQEMQRDSRIIIFGEDVGYFGGLFGCTKGLQQEFGEERVRDTPISEAAIIGTAIGAALTGLRPIAEIEFIDFIGCGMDQVFNQLAKMRYMSGGQLKLPVVIRTPCGSRYPIACGAAQHSQCLEAWFIHTPGLKVVIPSTPYDAKGLLISSIRDDDPVLFIEHKFQYYARRQPWIRERYPKLIEYVPQEPYTIPLGKADVKRDGEDVTVIATMMMVHKSLRVSEALEKEGISVEVIDPRTLVPLDKDTIIKSVKKTGRVIIITEENLTGSVASEILSIIVENAFDYLDAPIKRVCAPDVPIPYSPVLEREVIPQEEDIEIAIKQMVGV